MKNLSGNLDWSYTPFMKKKFFIAFILSSLLGFAFFVATRPSPELQVISEMYRDYFQNKNASVFKIPYSTGLANLIKENELICSQIKSQDICGWGANNDVLFNDQEYADNLNMENSKFRAKLNGVEVEVNFHVYPSMPKEARYKKRIIFKMLEENGIPLIDDITYHAGKGGVYSAREIIKAETDYYKSENSK